MRVGWKKYEATKKGEERDGCEESRKERNPCGRLIRACSSIHPLFIHRPPPLFFFFLNFPRFLFWAIPQHFPLEDLTRVSENLANQLVPKRIIPAKNPSLGFRPCALVDSLSSVWSEKERLQDGIRCCRIPRRGGGFDPERAPEKQSPPFRYIICQLWVTCSKEMSAG